MKTRTRRGAVCRVIGAIEALEGRTLMSALADVNATGARFGVVQTASGVAYSRDGSKLDVFRPTGGAPPAGGFPAIIALPGGGWRKADRRDYGGAVAATFGPSGYVVVPADYAYDSPGGARSWPRSVEDVRAVVRWVRTHADSLGVNPNKVIVSGESAGGHLAALAGTLPDGPFDPDGSGRKLVDANPVSGKPNAVVDFYGPTDLPAEWRDRIAARPYLASYLGGSLAQVPGRYRAASPITFVTPDDPPTFIVQGTADKIIPVSQSTSLDAALKAAGVPEALTLIPGVPHGFRFQVGSLNLGREVRTFLDRVGVGSGLS